MSWDRPRPGTGITDKRTESQGPNPGGVDIGYPQESKQGDGTPPSPVSPHPQVPGPRSVSLQPGPAVRDASHPGDPQAPFQTLISFLSQGPLSPLTTRDDAHPDFVPLPQEGWQTVSVLVTQRGPLLKEHHDLTQRLQSLLEEVERCALGSNER